MSHVTVHRLTRETARLLDSVTDDVFDHPLRADSLEDFLACPRHEMFFAEADRRVVGMCSSFTYFHPDKPAQMFINEVGVDEAYRRRGIGRKLLDAMVELARERGLAYAWLGTASDNVEGKALFGSASDPDDNPQPFLLYEWDLEWERQNPGG